MRNSTIVLFAIICQILLSCSSNQKNARNPIKITVEEAYNCRDMASCVIRADSALAVKYVGMSDDTLFNKNPLLYLLRLNTIEDESLRLYFVNSSILGTSLATDTSTINEFFSQTTIRNFFPQDAAFKWTIAKKSPKLLSTEEDIMDTYNLTVLKKFGQKIVFVADDLHEIILEDFFDYSSVMKLIYKMKGISGIYSATFVFGENGMNKLETISSNPSYFLTGVEIIGKKYYVSQTYEELSYNLVVPEVFNDTDVDSLKANYGRLVK